MLPKKSDTFPTVPTVPPLPVAVISARIRSIELPLLESLKRGHPVKLTPAKNARVTAPGALGSSASTPHGCGANATERASILNDFDDQKLEKSGFCDRARMTSIASGFVVKFPDFGGWFTVHVTPLPHTKP